MFDIPPLNNFIVKALVAEEKLIKVYAKNEEEAKKIAKKDGNVISIIKVAKINEYKQHTPTISKKEP